MNQPPSKYHVLLLAYVTIAMFAWLYAFNIMITAYNESPNVNEYHEMYYTKMHLIEDLEYKIKMQDSVIHFLNNDNQILSSYLGELEEQK